MDKQNYKPRVIDAKVKEYLSAFGAFALRGPSGAERPGLPLITAKARSTSVILPTTFKIAS